MNEEIFNRAIRKFLKHFGITVQREIEKAVYDAIKSGKLSGTETLKARAGLEIEALGTQVLVEHDIALS